MYLANLLFSKKTRVKKNRILKQYPLCQLAERFLKGRKMSEKQIIINEIKNKIGFYTVVVLTLALVLGFSNNISAKTKIKTYKITYVLKGGTNNKKNTKKYKSTWK